VEVLPGNAAVWDLLMQCRTQWRVGFGGVYAIDLAAVIEAARCCGIVPDGGFLEKVGIFEEEVLRALRRKEASGPCSEEKRKQCEEVFGREFLAWACRNCEEMKGKRDGRK